MGKITVKKNGETYSILEDNKQLCPVNFISKEEALELARKAAAHRGATVEVVEDESIMGKIKTLFGENYVIKSKKVKSLVDQKLEAYKHDTLGMSDEIIHRFNTGQTYKVGSETFELWLHATQMKNGKWWIRA